MVTISNADNALKTFYLGVLADQLNVGVNPLMAKIGQTTADVWGKEVKKLAPFGINGGVGSGEENDELPKSGGNNYAQFTLTLKNLFGKIEISDKAMRASQNSAGAFVNLLNAEMEGLLKASKFNFGRMLYGDGSGLVAITADNESSRADQITVTSIKCLMEGMTIDVYDDAGVKDTTLSGARILNIDRANNILTLSKSSSVAHDYGCEIYVQGSKNNEITGLGAIFGDSDTLYGLNRSDYSFLTPYQNYIDDTLTIAEMQNAIDTVEEVAGGAIDMIVTSYNLRKQYVNQLTANRTNIDYLTLDGGYKALSYSGIPVVADRFVADEDMYLLNTKDFKLHQLCDWRWLEGEGGTVLHQVPSKACYSATLVKYADLLCERPMGQAKITFSGKITPDYYTVKFDTDGGTIVPDQLVKPGGKVVQPPVPARTGSIFDGWLKNGVKYQFNNAYVYNDMTLYAKWLAN